MTSLRRLVIRLIAGFSLLALLAGCQSSQYAGNGPLVLTADTTKSFEKYDRFSSPGAFFISESGDCARYSRCPASSGSCARTPVGRAMDFCEYVCKQPCGVLAIYGEIVWKGPVTGAHGKLLNP